jgi:hexosaminidase
MRKTSFLIFISLLFIGANAQVNIIPVPVKATLGKGNFNLTKNTSIKIDDDNELAAADFFNEYLKANYGFKLKVSKQAAGNAIQIDTRKFIKAPDNAERYTMEVTPAKISIEGDTYEGTFNGIQTLIQLLPVTKSTSLKIPAVSIEDYPRFKYRGLHLDVSRHFFPTDVVKKYIDYIALHKMNYFHWHLTDDQGWRIEIKKYPELTKAGAYRNGTIIGRSPGKGNDSIRYGGFYTQDEVKEVVAYAAKRYITVIPEIEMPGHASAALTAYPNLGCTGGPYQVQQRWGVFKEVFCAGNDSVFSFLQDVLDEVIPLFPAEYVHVGGDECPKDSWKVCPKCQKRIADNHLKDEHELQSYFIQRMEKYINSKGKKMIGWDEILEGGLAPNAIVMSWRGEQGGIDAAKQNHDVIMTPGSYVYFDHSQSRNEDSVTIGGYLPVDKTYSYEPVPAQLTAEQAKHVLGAQANLWTEYIGNTAKLEYMLFPRLTALSEVLWSPKEKRDWKDFEKRLQTEFRRYDLWKTNYSRAYFDLKTSIEPAPDGNGIVWVLQNDSKKGTICYKTKDASKLSNYTQPIVIKNNDEIGATLVINNKPQSWAWQQFSINKATGKKITLSSQASDYYPGNGGAFGLINGAMSKMGINSAEWQGWTADSMVAVIDLGSNQQISDVNIHVLEQNRSRIYNPAMMRVLVASEGSDFREVAATDKVSPENTGMGNMRVSFDPTAARYLKIVVKNHGKIQQGNDAGKDAWMFIDEIQAN